MSEIESFVSDKFGKDIKIVSSGDNFAFITPPAKIKDIKASLSEIDPQIQNTLMIL